MPAEPSEVEELRKRTRLLRKTAELYMEELAALSDRRWEELPEIKKKKVILAGRFREIDWKSSPTDREPFDLKALKSLISDLENHSRRKIQAQLDLMGNQIFALQDQHLYWQECLSVSFQKFYEPSPSA